VISVVVLMSFANDRFIGFHATIGVMLIALAMSLCLIGAERVGMRRPRPPRGAR
jgi:hypothetical protein